MNQLRGRTLLLGVTVLALVLAASTLAAAQKSTKTEVDHYTNIPFAGQTVAVDPQTGKLRPPTPDEARQLGMALRNYLNRSSQGLTVKTHPNGAQSVDLQGRFQSVSLAKVNPDGSASEKCVTSMQEAEEFLKSSPEKKKVASDAPAARANHQTEEK
jgi:hypothetical protein